MTKGSNHCSDSRSVNRCRKRKQILETFYKLNEQPFTSPITHGADLDSVWTKQAATVRTLPFLW